MAQRYFVKLSFKGTNYHGWQIQANATAIQEVLNKAFSTILRQNIYLIGAGRTDTGVHARMFFAHFDCDSHIEDIAKLKFRLNNFLPKDFAVHDIYPVAYNAHARFHATSRTYKYIITQEKDPFMDGFAFFYPLPLNMEFMNTAGEILFEYTDFSSFEKSHSEAKTSTCVLYKAYWEREGHQLQFTIKADRFLRNMVRAIVGTLLEVGKERIPPHALHEIINARNRSKAGFSVPAHGLYLTDITYPDTLVS